MLKKVVLGTLLVGLIGILVAGAIIRTVDKTGNVAEAQGLGGGNGHGRGVEAVAGTEGYEAGGYAQGEAAVGYGRGAGGNGQGNAANSTVERSYPNFEEAPDEWLTYEGTVVQAPEAGVDLIVDAGPEGEIVIGTGPSYMAAQDFALQAGEQVQVLGYWEDGEFKAAQVTRLRDGATISLRDEVGRPAWSGAGQRALVTGTGGYGGEGNTASAGDGTGTGQAEVDAWLNLQGTVVSVDADALVVESGGEQVLVENRPWWFAQDQGFTTQVGNQLTLTGFYEDGDFEVGRIDDATSGQTVLIRDENGRPLWAGGGRRGG
jgi:hypothetical protein